VTPPYVVHSGAALGRALLRVAALAAVAVLLGGVVRHHWWWAGLVCVGLLALASSGLRTAWTRLRVDASGIALSFPQEWHGRVGDLSGAQRRFATWPLVHRVEVHAGAQRVRVVLRADAPLPPWRRGRVVDPRDPESGPVVEQHVPGLDPEALQRAVLAHSPTTPVQTLP